MNIIDKKYLLQSQIRIARLSRIIAKSIDLFIALILCTVVHPLGVLLAVAYLCISDSLQHGQSVGKKFIGLAVISLDDGRPCSFRQSSIRNLPLIIPTALLIIPFWGWLLAILLGLPLVSLELYLLFSLDSGHRLGDVMADTTVIANDPHRLNLTKKRESWFESERPL
ncbi:MAG: RDD family protein [Oligoflexia bacterium]|nr:RDD family protein [Oligoflexia bacterium]